MHAQRDNRLLCVCVTAATAAAAARCHGPQAAAAATAALSLLPPACRTQHCSTPPLVGLLFLVYHLALLQPLLATGCVQPLLLLCTRQQRDTHTVTQGSAAVEITPTLSCTATRTALSSPPLTTLVSTMSLPFQLQQRIRFRPWSEFAESNAAVTHATHSRTAPSVAHVTHSCVDSVQHRITFLFTAVALHCMYAKSQHAAAA